MSRLPVRHLQVRGPVVARSCSLAVSCRTVGTSALPIGFGPHELALPRRVGRQMDSRMLSGIALAGLSALFGSYGIFMLVAAYRAGNLTVWGRRAILGGISVLLSAVLANIAVTRLMAEVSQHL